MVSEESFLKDHFKSYSLNPCCRGIWSRSWFLEDKELNRGVLILVVVEYGLGVNKKASML